MAPKRCTNVLITALPPPVTAWRVAVFALATGALALLLALAALPPRPAAANGVGTIFVANERSNSVSVLEHVSNSVLANIPVGASPRSIAFSSDGRLALVANRGGGTLTQIDRDLYEPSATIRVGGTPESVVAPTDTTFSIVADSERNFVLVVDSAGQIARTIGTAGRPTAVAADRGGRRVYVAIEGSDALAVFDATSGASAGSVAVGGLPSAITLSADGAAAYVSLVNVNALAVVDTAAMRVTARHETGAGPAGSTLGPNNRLYIANTQGNSVTVIDVARQRLLGSIAVGQGPRSVAISPDGGAYAYVANSGSDSVSVIDLAQARVARTVPVGQGPVFVAVASVPGPAQLPAGETRPGSGGTQPGNPAPGPGGPGAGVVGGRGGGSSVPPAEMPSTGGAPGALANGTGPVALVTAGVVALATAAVLLPGRRTRHARAARRSGER